MSININLIEQVWHIDKGIPEELNNKETWEACMSAILFSDDVWILDVEGDRELGMIWIETGPDATLEIMTEKVNQAIATTLENLL
jgi:hypothetical protein